MVSELSALSDRFMAKAGDFSDIVKMGRRQLQDAVPMTLGQEFERHCS
jgi:aspartate ammonia-lyase